MTFSIQSIINNAKNLSKSYEKNAVSSENLILQISNVFEDINRSCSHKSANDGKIVNGQPNEQQTSASKPHSLVIYTIQRESNQVHKLRCENLVLKQHLEEYEFALELIMSKYRRKMLKLLDDGEKCQTNIIDQHDCQRRVEQQAKVIHLTNRLQEMDHIYTQQVNPLLEKTIVQQKQLLKELLVEHKGLVELLNISKQFGSSVHPKMFDDSDTDSDGDDLITKKETPVSVQANYQQSVAANYQLSMTNGNTSSPTNHLSTTEISVQQ